MISSKTKTKTSSGKNDKINGEKKGTLQNKLGNKASNLQNKLGNKVSNLQGKLDNKASNLQNKLGTDPSALLGSINGNSNKPPQLTQNVPNKLPLKPSTLTTNARKLEYKMYKEAFVILRFQKINLTFQLMTKITKTMQTNIRNEFKQNLQKLTKNIPNKKNKELKVFQSILGTIRNNFKKIKTINASSLTISQQNKKNTLDTLIKELFQQFKTVPENVTKKEKLIIYYYLQTLIDQLYFLYNIDLSEKNNKNIYDFGTFYRLMFGELKNLENFLSLSNSKNIKTGGKNNEKTSTNIKKTNTGTNSKTNTGTNSKTNTKTNTGTNSKTNTGTNSKTNTGTNSKINTGTNSKTNTGTNSKINTESSINNGNQTTAEKIVATVAEKQINSSNNISKQKFTLLKQGLLLYRLTIILGLLESMKKICKTIQTKFTTQYKNNLASFKKEEGVNSHQIQNFSQAISMFGTHFNNVTQLNEKKFFQGMENNEINPLKKNVLNNLMNQLNNNFKTIPQESTKKNKVQIQYLLQNLIQELFYLFSKNLNAKNSNNFSVDQFLNQLMKNIKK